MLGGGVFITQNKVLPGSYINFVNASSASSTIGDRGVVAIALPLGKAVGTVITLTASDFLTKCQELTGKAYDSADVLPLREIFRHASKVYVYDLGTGDTAKTVYDFIEAIEAYDFNVICYLANDGGMDEPVALQVQSWRDDMGKKCQFVGCSDCGEGNHEGVILVDNDGATESLVYWVAGAMAGCKINESCTNMLYDGELTINPTYSQEILENCLEQGVIVFHRVYGEIRLLEDINSFIETTADKGEDFKYNQTIRVVDQIANDIAKLFNTKYLGKIPNNASGRVSLWGDIVKHHRELEALEAIEKFDSTLLTVEQGATKKSVVVNDAITVVNAMAQLYMTVVIQ